MGKHYSMTFGFPAMQFLSPDNGGTAGASASAESISDTAAGATSKRPNAAASDEGAAVVAAVGEMANGDFDVPDFLRSGFEEADAASVETSPAEAVDGGAASAEAGDSEEVVQDEPAKEHIAKPDTVESVLADLAPERRELIEQMLADAKAAKGETLEPEKKDDTAGEMIEKATAFVEPDFGPLSEVEDMAGLTAERDRALRLQAVALENLDGGYVKDSQGNDVGITPQSARKMLAETNALLHKYLPTRERHLQMAQQNAQVARQVYPWMNDAKSPEARMLAGLKAVKNLRNAPDYELILANAVDAQFRLMQRGKETTPAKPEVKKAEAKAKTPIAPQHPSGGLTPMPGTRTRIAAGENRMATAMQAMQSSGGRPDDVADFWKAFDAANSSE